MSIISSKRDFWEAHIAPVVPKKLHALFRFGYDTLVCMEMTSMRANARLANIPWATAKSKVWRLATNPRIVPVFVRLVTSLALVRDGDLIAVDFSDFRDGRQVLMFAKQTEKGRALPLYFEILEYPVTEGSQNRFVNEVTARFLDIIGVPVTLVFDRGFAAPAIVKFLLENNILFIIRIKKRKRLTDANGILRSAEEFVEHDIAALGYHGTLRLIRSDDPKNGNDPWYLITNDTASSREEIVRQYYHRFEIEEFFRDAKRLLGLEYVRFRSAGSCAIALWFAICTIWIFATIADTLSDADEALRRKCRLSRFRFVFERFRKEMFAAVVIGEKGGVTGIPTG